jgi:hypothetical protein
MSVGDLADYVTVAVGVSAFVVFVFGSRVRETVVAWHRMRTMGRLSRAHLTRSLIAVAKAPFVSRGWQNRSSVAELLTFLAPAGAEGRDVSWGADSKALEVASFRTRGYAFRLRTSIWGRLGSSEQIDSEAVNADAVAALLAGDAAYRRLKHRGREPAENRLTASLAALGIRMLAGPAFAGARSDATTGDRTTFDEVRVSERHGEQYGVVGTLDQIAAGAGEHCFPGLPHEAVDAISGHAAKLARSELGRGRDTFNGSFARLLDWRVESAVSHPGRRLHLLTAQTTYFTWLTLNAKDRIVFDDPGLPPLFCEQSPGNSLGACHLPVGVTLITADGYLVMRRRSYAAAIFPGRLESAANGNPEVDERPGAPMDRDEHGLLRFSITALREMREELGAVPIPWEPRLTALLLNDEPDERACPYLSFEARTSADFEGLGKHFSLADPTEGFHESEGELVGLSVAPDRVGGSVHFLLNEPSLRPIARAATLITLFAISSSTALEREPRPDQRSVVTLDRTGGGPGKPKHLA